MHAIYSPPLRLPLLYCASYLIGPLRFQIHLRFQFDWLSVGLLEDPGLSIFPSQRNLANFLGFQPENYLRLLSLETTGLIYNFRNFL